MVGELLVKLVFEMPAIRIVDDPRFMIDPEFMIISVDMEVDSNTKKKQEPK